MEICESKKFAQPRSAHSIFVLVYFELEFYGQASGNTLLNPFSRFPAFAEDHKQGFTFLGQTFRKHGKRLHITPSSKRVLALVQKVGELIRKHVSAPMPVLIRKLNQTLLGWANYHRQVVASEAFFRIDTYVYEQLWRMVSCRHQNKSKGWLIKKY